MAGLVKMHRSTAAVGSWQQWAENVSDHRRAAGEYRDAAEVGFEPYSFLLNETLLDLPCIKTTLRLIVLSIALIAGTSAQTEPVDLTGLSCMRMTNFGSNTWEFYGDIAVRRYDEGQGQPQRFVRVGEGAYERYSRIDGEWDAVYYFFDVGDGVQMRIFSRPGLNVREKIARVLRLWSMPLCR